MSDIYDDMNCISNQDNDKFIRKYDNYKVYKNDTGLYECDDCNTLNSFYPAANNIISLEQSIDILKKFNRNYQYHIYNMVIPNDVTHIGQSFFKGGFIACNLKLPYELSCINSYAFSNSNISTLFLSESLTNIGMESFSSCMIGVLVCPRKQIFLESNSQTFVDAEIKHLVLPRNLFDNQSDLVNINKALESLKASHTTFIEKVSYY